MSAQQLLSRRLLIVAVACVGALGAGAAAAKKPAEKPVATIKDLETKEIQVSPDPPTDVKPQQAIEQYRHFLELQSKNEKMRSEAMRRLGDLQIGRASCRERV